MVPSSFGAVFASPCFKHAFPAASITAPMATPAPTAYAMAGEPPPALFEEELEVWAPMACRMAPVGSPTGASAGKTAQETSTATRARRMDGSHSKQSEGTGTLSE